MIARSGVVSTVVSLLLHGVFIACTVAFLMNAPMIAHAQANVTAQTTQPPSDLSATVRSAILADPRSSSMTPAQVDSLVAALTAQAQAQGVTAHDIAWRPEVPGPAPATVQAGAVAGDCGSVPALLCSMGVAMGFPAGSWMLSLILLSVLGIAIVIIAVMIEHARKRKVNFANVPTLK